MRRKKVIYISIIGFLTSTACSAAYWQTSRYLQSRKRWSLISQQLSKKQPDELNVLEDSSKFPMKYVQVNGSMDQNAMMISRGREGRMGKLIVRGIEYKNKRQQKQTILAVQGWIPDDYEYKCSKQEKKFKGILREKEKIDYLHQKMKQEDIQKFNINTYIDVDKAIKELNLADKNVYTQYYLEILKDIESNADHYYPYQYSVDNFQLPYLTPDKHRAYALFWTLTSTVGFWGIFRVFKMK